MGLYFCVLCFCMIIQITFCCVHVKLSTGVIKGRLTTSIPGNKTFYAFQEIPYATPPVGNLRFQPPQPVTPWTGILDTTKNTKICYQTNSDSDKETEDCLYLNVYTPLLLSEKAESALPVMVYFHGGGFIIGDGTHQSYGPEFLINYDVVIVTLNYRLGVFGFLSTQDEIIPGNNGLKDQLFALQWVNRNIHIFGGDSSKVTIFGQSAGAASVGYHLISEKSRGLYRAAIMESGSALNPWAYQRDAKRYAQKLITAITDSVEWNCSTPINIISSEEILDVLSKLPAKDIDEASHKLDGCENYYDAQLLQGYYFAPVVEPPQLQNAFLTERMFEVLKRGDANRVPIIMGFNSEESISPTTDENFVKAVMSRFDEDLKALVPNDMNIESETKRTEAGGLIRKLYSGDDLLQSNSSYGVKYMSDTSFIRAVIKFAQVQSNYSDVYFYQFSYDGKMGNVSITVEATERVGHNEEVAYLWRCRTDLFDNYDLSTYPESDIIAHTRLLTLWTNFAKNLHPTHEKLDLLQNITWPTVSSINDFLYLDINDDLTINNHPRESTFSGWNQIYDEYGTEPYDTY